MDEFLDRQRLIEERDAVEQIRRSLAVSCISGFSTADDNKKNEQTICVEHTFRLDPCTLQIALRRIPVVPKSSRLCPNRESSHASNPTGSLVL